MTRFNLTQGFGLALGCAALCLNAPLRAGDQVPFEASLHGFAVSNTPEPPECADCPIHTIGVELDGHATILGRFHDDLLHHLNLQTLAFTGTSTLTTANGDSISTEFHGQLYPTDDPEWLTFDVFHTIIGGTGRFVGASGSFVGVAGRFNLVTGEDIAGYVGTISSPGSLKK